MSDLRDRYLACWNETEPDARRALLSDHWAPDASYVDPLVEANGVDEIDAVMAGTQQEFAGFVFTAVGEVDAHHRVARFGWGLGGANAEPLVLGFDVLSTDDSGRIKSVVGFLDRVPE
jgi:hypothetical protein